MLVVGLRLSGPQNLPYSGPMETNLTADGTVAQPLSAKGEDRLTKVNFVGKRVIG